MAWYTGKTALAVANIGDSNAFASGGFTPPGGQTLTAGAFCYASASGQFPYSEANLGWYNLNPNATNRIPEYDSYIATTSATAAFVGQALGGNGNPGMQANNVLKVGTGINSYLYQCAAGGTTAQYWAEGNGWTTLLRTIPAALAAIPGSPTAFDCISLSMGGNDAIQGVPEETYVSFMNVFRANTIAQGWWIPGVTQIVMLDMPRSGLIWDDFGSWKGMEKVIARFNDRVGRTNSSGLKLVDSVHYDPPSYTNQGQQAGEMFLAEVPMQQSTLNIGGVGLSLNGSRFRVHGN